MTARELSEKIWKYVCEEQQFQIKEVKKRLEQEDHLTYNTDYDATVFSNAISTLMREELIERKSTKKDGFYVVIGKTAKEKKDELKELKSAVLQSVNEQCEFLEKKIEEKKILDYVEAESGFSVLNDIVGLLKYLKKFKFSE